jgi:hypothetical protein
VTGSTAAFPKLSKKHEIGAANRVRQKATYREPSFVIRVLQQRLTPDHSA